MEKKIPYLQQSKERWGGYINIKVDFQSKEYFQGLRMSLHYVMDYVMDVQLIM